MTTTCPTCAREVTPTKSGAPRKHNDPGTGNTCAGGILRTWDIALPWVRPACTPNMRLHPLRTAALMREMKTDAGWAIRAAKLPFLPGAEVAIHWRVPDRKVRDADSLQLALKAATDALVEVGVLAGDSWVEVPAAHMHIHPPVKGLPGSCWLSVTEVKP